MKLLGKTKTYFVGKMVTKSLLIIITMVITTYVNQKCIKMLLFDRVLILKKFSNFRLWCPEIAEFQNGIIDYGP